MSRRRWPFVTLIAVALAAGSCLACNGVKRAVIQAFTPVYRVKGDPTLQATFEGADLQRPRVAIALGIVGTGFDQPTDIQFVPGTPELMVVLQKEGLAQWFSLADQSRGELLRVEVLTASEEGLLGLAFHPRFAENGRFFLNYVLEQRGKDTSRVEEWSIPAGADLRTAKPKPVRTIMEVEQPYPNHNAGQLAFGPDGYLYVGWGDGGLADDPDGNGQAPQTLLGKMLRIDVDRVPAGSAYGIPADNPFAGSTTHRPEIWALGLRNPWRYAFGPEGQLIVADVGQNTWEELSLITPGANLGWDTREGRHCFEPERNCRTDGLVDPIYEYSHEEGQSISGGYVYTGTDLPALRGKYVFGDFVTGRLWAIDLPREAVKGAPLAKAYALGKWPILPSTFGIDARGELYVGDFYQGIVYRLVSPDAVAPAVDGGVTP